MLRVVVWSLMWSLFIAACAQATPDYSESSDGPDAAEGASPDAFVPARTPDAAVVPATPDAAVVPGTPDAAPPPPPIDAAPPPPPPDAAVSGLFCASNADCPSADDCCFLAFCVPGLEIGDLCFPTE